MDNEQTLVIGLGEIGKPLLEVIARHHHPTRGIDLEPAEPDAPVGVMHVCIPAEVSGGFVPTVVDYAKRFEPAVIVINSTVTPGTTREVERASGRAAVFSPVRGKHTRMAEELVHYTKFVAGSDAAATERVRRHFDGAGIETAVMATPEALELAKLLETTYFGLLIAWAQEMDRFARAVDADYMQLTEFFEEVGYLPRHVFLPGHIGGHCVMPNIGILKRRVESPMLDAIVDSNRRRGEELKVDSAVPRERLQPRKLGSS
jgi:UDP-N-acetyl-D-mannosaminuronate dehydrogenase